MGFSNVDKLSTTITGEEVPLLSTFPSLEKLPTALDGIATTSGELSDAFDGMSTVFENLHLLLLICLLYSSQTSLRQQTPKTCTTPEIRASILVCMASCLAG